jgi:hypothetical protein
LHGWPRDPAVGSGHLGEASRPGGVRTNASCRWSSASRGILDERCRRRKTGCSGKSGPVPSGGPGPLVVPASVGVKRHRRLLVRGLRRRGEATALPRGFSSNACSCKACISASFVDRTRQNSGSSVGRPSQIRWRSTFQRSRPSSLAGSRPKRSRYFRPPIRRTSSDTSDSAAPGSTPTFSCSGPWHLLCGSGARFLEGHDRKRPHNRSARASRFKPRGSGLVPRRPSERLTGALSTPGGLVRRYGRT